MGYTQTKTEGKVALDPGVEIEFRSNGADPRVIQLVAAAYRGRPKRRSGTVGPACLGKYVARHPVKKEREPANAAAGRGYGKSVFSGS